MNAMSRGLTIFTMALLAAIYIPMANAKGGGGHGGGGGHCSGGGGGGHSSSGRGGARGYGGGGRGYGGGGYTNQDTQNTNPYVNQATDTSNYGRGSSH
jgi:hypothetical protein